MNQGDTLGQRIRKRREALKLTQQDLASTLGVTPQHISAVEQDKRRTSFESVVSIARALGVTVDYLLTGQQSVIMDTVPAIKADDRLSVQAKKALIGLVQELYEAARQQKL